MNVIIFTSILCSIFTSIRAPLSPPLLPGNYSSRRYPTVGSVDRNGLSSLFSSSRRNFSPQPDDVLDEFRKLVNTVKSNTMASPLPSWMDRPDMRRSTFPDWQFRNSVVNPTSSPTRTQKISTGSPQCTCKFCELRRTFPSSFNERTRFQSPSGAPRPRVRRIPITLPENSPDPSTSPTDATARPNNSKPEPSAASNQLNGSSSTKISPAQGDDDESNSSSKIQDPPQVEMEVPKNEKEKSSKDKKDGAKKSEQAPEQLDEPPEKSQSDTEWEGPKTPEEDKPERYSVEENIKFVRAYSNNMTKLGKYKVAETINYLLTQKGHELDTADRAAISYIINERLKKDPEVIEALKKYNEKFKTDSETKPSEKEDTSTLSEIIAFNQPRISTRYNRSTSTQSPLNRTQPSGPNAFSLQSPSASNSPTSSEAVLEEISSSLMNRQPRLRSSPSRSVHSPSFSRWRSSSLL